MDNSEINPTKISRWKKADMYYLSLAGGILFAIYAEGSRWQPVIIITLIIGIIGFVIQLMNDRLNSRGLALLGTYGWIPLDIITISYLIKNTGFYNNAFFIVLALLPGICAPVWWLWKGDNISVKIYSLYLLGMMTFWVVLRIIDFPSYVPTAAIYYGSILIAIIWMLAIAPKIFVKYDEENVSRFLLLWLAILLLDVVLFQVMPWISTGTAMFTDIPWAR